MLVEKKTLRTKAELLRKLNSAKISDFQVIEEDGHVMAVVNFDREIRAFMNKNRKKNVAVVLLAE